MTILPRLVNISPKKVIFTPKYVDLRALSHLRVFSLSWNPPECQDWGGQANLGNARIFTVFVTATPSLPRYRHFSDIIICLYIWRGKCFEDVDATLLLFAAELSLYQLTNQPTLPIPSNSTKKAQILFSQNGHIQRENWSGGGRGGQEIWLGRDKKLVTK